MQPLKLLFRSGLNSVGMTLTIYAGGTKFKILPGGLSQIPSYFTRLNKHKVTLRRQIMQFIFLGYVRRLSVIFECN